MNFISWFSFLYFFISSSKTEIYKSIQGCVFNSAGIFQVYSQIQCALKCNLNGYRGFKFNNSLCILYKDREICQSDTTCRNKSIFINEKVSIFQLSISIIFLFQYLADSRRKKYDLLNGVKSQIFTGILSVYKIINGEFMRIFIKAKSSNLISISTSLIKLNNPSLLA